MKTDKISMFGKIIVVFASIMSIVMVSGKWLDLYQIPMIFGDSVQHEYSLFEISDFMDTFNMYLDNDSVRGYSALLSVGAVAVIVLSVLSVIAAFVNARLSRISSVMLMTVCIILAGVFIGTIIHINGEVEEATYGGIEELLKGTSKPYWLTAFSVLNMIGAMIKKKAPVSIVPAGAKADIGRSCTGCGAPIPSGAQFCTRCGKKSDEIQNTANERFCVACGAKMAPGMAFCTSCGAKAD